MGPKTPSNFTAIWVFNLQAQSDEDKFKVYQEFDVRNAANNTETKFPGPFLPIAPPEGGYGQAVFP